MPDNLVFYNFFKLLVIFTTYMNFTDHHYDDEKPLVVLRRTPEAKISP